MKINDVFWTIQGEGANMGRRALFVRMPFCNLNCSWCDTSYNTFTDWTDERFIEFATQEPGRFAVITGGEPTMNKTTPRVIELLKGLGFELSIETNGMFDIPDGIDFVTCSPKRDSGYEVCDDAFKKANEFKYVVDEGFQWEILNRHEVTDGRRYSLTPEFGQMEKSVAAILAFISKNPQWKLNLQTHKWISVK